MKKVEIIATLGPSTNTVKDLEMIKDKGVDYVRINMSHSNIEDLKHFIKMAKEVDIPFIIDTEGSQVRTGELETPTVEIAENEEIKIYQKPIIGNKNQFSLKPGHIVPQLEKGDLIQIDFDTAVFRVIKTDTINQGYIKVKAVTGGILGKNKAVVIDSASSKKIKLPALSEKDYESIKVGLEHGVGHIALSFARSGKCLDEVRAATQNTMKVISKIECIDALENIDEIISKSDYLLIDRGDLSKEIPVEKIPFTQKIILNKARKSGVGVFVATNLLETMIDKRKPTRAEVHDIINTIVDGADGLVLAAETAVGNYPMECINMLNKLIKHADLAIDVQQFVDKENELVQSLLNKNYLLDQEISSTLIEPHGGKLINRMAAEKYPESYIQNLPKIKIDQNKQRDAEQIAIGTYSPLEGFMGKNNFQSVLDRMKLSSGTLWPLPIFLDVNKTDIENIEIGQDLALTNKEGTTLAILHLNEIFEMDKEEIAQKIYGTLDLNHPGVQLIMKLKEVFLGGKISLLKRRDGDYKEYELTPKQSRSLFEERGWSKVVGFHTRNVPHRGHEFIQLNAMEKENCDGLFIHPVVGKKKAGDFNAKYIIKAYEIMNEKIYPKNKVVFGTFSTYSRYAGPREALFTALCRKNFGCSHFIVGRDHTGVGNFYHPKASHNIFDRFPEIGITPIKFDKVYYSKNLGQHAHTTEQENTDLKDQMHLSGTEARKILENGEMLPEWFMRKEISTMIIDAIRNNKNVFVKEKNDNKNPEREKENENKDEKEYPAKVFWMTGLSGSGKTTIANQFKEELKEKGKNILILDGDVVRERSHKHLGFNREDIKENNRLIAQIVNEEKSKYDLVIVPVISPYLEDREMVKNIIGKEFVEVFINAPIEECITRDAKGLYKKALSGEIDNFIGISPSNPYQAPLNPDIEIKTNKINIKESVQQLHNFLKNE
jgi:pyruvate kinase